MISRALESRGGGASSRWLWRPLVEEYSTAANNAEAFIYFYFF